MTQVQRIEIGGFRSLKSVSWEPDRLNVVIGPNGSGKSNLLRAPLELLRESATGKLRDAVLAEGGLRQLLWDHRAHEISWKLKLPILFKSDSDSFVTYDLALQPSMLLLGADFQISRALLTDSGRPDPDVANQPLPARRPRPMPPFTARRIFGPSIVQTIREERDES